MSKFKPLPLNGVYVPPSLTPPWWVVGLTWAWDTAGAFLLIVGIPAIVVLALVALGVK